MILAAAFAWAIAALAVACGLTAASIGARRVGRRYRERRAERLLEPIRTSVYDLVAGEPDEVAAAARRLRAVGGATWAPLQQLLVDLLGKVRGDSIAPVLRLLGERHVLEQSRRRLDARSAVARARAAHLLGLLRDAASVRALERRLTDRDGEVRIVAARALGRIGDPRAAPALIAALAGRRPVPAGVVGEALLQLGAGIQAAMEPALAAADPTTRGVAAEIAGLGGLIGLLQPLRCTLAADPDPEVRVRTATALGCLGSAYALPELIDALDRQQPPRVRVAAAEALGAIGDPAAASHLESLLDAPAQLADTAAWALVELGPAGLATLRCHESADQPSPAAGALAIAALRTRVGEP